MTPQHDLQRSELVESKPVYREPKGRALALEIVVAQGVFTGVLSVLTLAIHFQIATAILTGGMICTLANLWLAVVAFRPALGKPVGQMLAAFYLGEIGKLIIVAVLFLIVFKKTLLFKQPPYSFLLLLSYVLAQCAAWVYPLARSKFFARWR